MEGQVALSWWAPGSVLVRRLKRESMAMCGLRTGSGELMCMWQLPIWWMLICQTGRQAGDKLRYRNKFHTMSLSPTQQRSWFFMVFFPPSPSEEERALLGVHVFTMLGLLGEWGCHSCCNLTFFLQTPPTLHSPPWEWVILHLLDSVCRHKITTICTKDFFFPLAFV